MNNDLMIEEKATAENLNKIFELYRAGKLSPKVNNSYLDYLLQNKQKTELVPKRVVALGKMVQRIQRELNARFNTRFNIFEHTTVSADILNGDIKTNIKIFNSNGKNSVINTAINININSLLQLPPEEVYAILKAHICHSLICNKLNKDGSMEDDFENVMFFRDQDEKNNLEEHMKDKNERIKARKILKTYFMGLFKDYFPDSFTKYDNIAEYVADDIVRSLDDGKIDEMLSTFFDMSTFDKAGIKKVEEFLGADYKTLSAARGSKLLQSAKEMHTDPGKEIEAIDYEKQYQALLSIQTKSKFEEAKNSQNNANIKDFCAEFINNFMASNGMAGFGDNAITFKNEGELGTFYTNPMSININLSKIKSATELVMTMSHELTHAKRAVLNASSGVYNREDGSLLVGGMDEDISGSGLKTNSQEYKFLKEVQNYCYHLDPNEREARIGELSALKFMKELAPERSAEIDESAKRYERYQQKTIDIANALKGNGSGAYKSIEALKSEYESMKANMPESARNLIEERIKYLEDLTLSSGSLDMSQEEKSMGESRKINGETISSEEIKKKKELQGILEEQQMGM